VRIAKELTENYEAIKFNDWKTKNTVEAIEMLHKNILRIDINSEGGNVFKVNFNPKLKVIIREAKFLDRIGKDIPATIINIALQEKDYMKYIDKLNQLLAHYDDSLVGLKQVEKRLLLTELG
jgi:dynein heavy chain